MTVTSVCLSVCLSSRQHIPGTTCTCPLCTQTFLRVSYGVTRFSFGGDAIRYVLPVSWMTSSVHVTGRVGACRSASDVTASSCAVCSAAAALYWCRQVLDDGGCLRARGAGGHSMQCARERRFAMSVSVCLCECVCLSAIISSELHVRSSPNFSCVLQVAVARSSYGGVLICYVLLVLWMTSYLLTSQGCSTSPPS